MYRHTPSEVDPKIADSVFVHDDGRAGSLSMSNVGHNRLRNVSVNRYC